MSEDCTAKHSLDEVEMAQECMTVCDRCGAREKSGPYNPMSGRHQPPETWKYLDGRDLCPDCWEAFKAWLEAGKRGA